MTDARAHVVKQVAIVTLPGFNEIDSFVAARMIDSVPGLEVELCGPHDTAMSMAGVEVATPGALSDLHTRDAVIVGSGLRTFEHIDNPDLMASFTFGETQLIGSQCSGAAILHRLGLVNGLTVCTDLTTTPKLRAIGVDVANEPFRSDGRIATSGGCLSSSYLAFWIIAELTTTADAITALEYVAPITEAPDYVERALALTQPSRSGATASASLSRSAGPSDQVRDAILNSMDAMFDQLMNRLEGMTDAEYLWEPAPGAWTVRTLPADGLVMVDGAGIREIDPAPVPTIAWRLWHIAIDCLDDYTRRFNGDHSDALPHWTLDAAEAIEITRSTWQSYRVLIADLDWLGELGDNWGPWSSEPVTAMALHAGNELVHHAAEIALLRDLYRVRQVASP